MSADTDPLRVLLLSVAGWVNRHQQHAVEYLVEENRVLKEQLSGRRLRLNDSQRRRLAAKGQRLGRRALTAVATIVTPVGARTCTGRPILGVPATHLRSVCAGCALNPARACLWRPEGRPQRSVDGGGGEARSRAGYAWPCQGSSTPGEPAATPEGGAPSDFCLFG